jgi:hypothetical protein
LDEYLIFMFACVAVMLALILSINSGPQTFLPLVGTIAAIVAAVASVGYWIEQRARWHSEDRPQVEPFRLRVGEDFDRLIWTIQNKGKDDATKVAFKFTTIDANRRANVLSTTPDQLPRLKSWSYESVTTLMREDELLPFIAVCIEYDDEIIGQRYYELPKFYYSPTRPLHGATFPASTVTSLENEALSAVFSCSKR